MLSPSQIEKMVETISENIPEGFGAVPENMKQQFKQSAQIAIQKMDLVTREEFDVQKQVLSKTRTKLEALEKQLEVIQSSEKV